MCGKDLAGGAKEDAMKELKYELFEERREEPRDVRILVIGVGGAGGNAVNTMIRAELPGVNYIVANTDSQHLDMSLCENKIHLGPETLRGLGAGADSELGRKAAEEVLDEIKEAVEGYHMVFLTAGMGGGTGTGASPVIAQAAREKGALTVAVVCKPFEFEGDKRMRRAVEGIEDLRDEVNSLIVIPNERLSSVGSKSTPFKDLMSRADNVLLQAVKGICNVVRKDGHINLDFSDMRKVMSENGSAIMGLGRASGENRMIEAAEGAISSPLLEDISIHGSKGLLVNIVGSSGMTMEEIHEACGYIKDQASRDAEILWGVVFDDQMGDEAEVTVIATGINAQVAGDNVVNIRSARSGTQNSRNPRQQQQNPSQTEEVASFKVREATPDEAAGEWTVRKDGENLDVPTFQRKGKTSAAISEMNRKKRRGFLERFGFKNDVESPAFIRAGLD
jgi:cell division protein FtsZ